MGKKEEKNENILRYEFIIMIDLVNKNWIKTELLPYLLISTCL